MIAAQSKSLVSKQTQLAKTVEVSTARVSQASTVIKYAPDLAEQVVSGALALNDAQSKLLLSNNQTELLRVAGQVGAIQGTAGQDSAGQVCAVEVGLVQVGLVQVGVG